MIKSDYIRILELCAEIDNLKAQIKRLTYLNGDFLQNWHKEQWELNKIQAKQIKELEPDNNFEHDGIPIDQGDAIDEAQYKMEDR